VLVEKGPPLKEVENEESEVQEQELDPWTLYLYKVRGNKGKVSVKAKKIPRFS
jgi:hypothetical protein